MSFDTTDSITFKIIRHPETHYFSIWPTELENPRGWSDTGHTGTKAECQGFIRVMWADIHPLSLGQNLKQPRPSL